MESQDLVLQLSDAPPGAPPVARPASLSVTPPPSAPSLSSVSEESRAARAALTRRILADWFQEAVGIEIPTHSDPAFRAALSDGVALCRLANALSPGIIPRVLESSAPSQTSSVASVASSPAAGVPRGEAAISPVGPAFSSAEAGTPGEVRQTFENVSNFIRAARTWTQDTFSARDLEDPEDRPAVARCLMSIRQAVKGV
ncbi:hypothetical protein H632_c1601p0, partial [Helicosporidium sp. ATCC 50920]